MAFDYWALFLERAINLLSSEGTLSVLVPFGIVGNEGATNLRKSLLKNRIRHLYEFENAHGIFPDVHRSYKFVLLIIDKTVNDKEFKAAFYLHDLTALDGKVENIKFVTLSNEFIELSSPQSLSIPEVRRQNDVTICTKLYRRHPLLYKGMGDYWKFTIMRELNRTESAGLFRTDGKGWMVIEGKNFHQFIANYERPTFTILKEKGLRQTSKVKEYDSFNKQIHEVPRLVFRTVASSTNVRTMIAAIIPKNTFVPNSASIILPRNKGVLNLDKQYFTIISYLVAVFNSMIFDFLIRLRVTMNLNFFYVYQTPIPSDWNSPIAKEIIKLAARLSSSEKSFKDLSHSVGVECGPISMKERIEMTSELDALVAHQYGISREEYSYILDSFSGFEVDENLEKLTEINWSDRIMKKLNGEVRKRAINYFDTIAQEKGDM